MLTGGLRTTVYGIRARPALYNEYVGSPQMCVFCHKHPVEHAWRPFCSERCKMLDLARWADGSYRVPAEPVPAAEDDREDDHKEGG